MIEYRGMLWKTKRFEGGFSLKKGTIIYVRETEHGWLGMYYEDTGSAHGFALEEDDFSILENADCQVQDLIVMPDPPEPPEKIRKEQEMQRKRLERQIERHRQTADELEQLLAKETA